jgi:hypothetical protein
VPINTQGWNIIESSITDISKKSEEAILGKI